MTIKYKEWLSNDMVYDGLSYLLKWKAGSKNVKIDEVLRYPVDPENSAAKKGIADFFSLKTQEPVIYPFIHKNHFAVIIEHQGRFLYIDPLKDHLASDLLVGYDKNKNFDKATIKLQKELETDKDAGWTCGYLTILIGFVGAQLLKKNPNTTANEICEKVKELTALLGNNKNEVLQNLVVLVNFINEQAQLGKDYTSNYSKTELKREVGAKVFNFLEHLEKLHSVSTHTHVNKLLKEHNKKIENDQPLKKITYDRKNNNSNEVEVVSKEMIESDDKVEIVSKERIGRAGKMELASKGSIGSDDKVEIVSKERIGKDGKVESASKGRFGSDDKVEIVLLR